ncbi:MAG: hypothetical protein HYY06_05530 [Deltaproteobacteria bacterium]|nr:hypothetical protein [Deltaproteobacteria bacterium]
MSIERRWGSIQTRSAWAVVAMVVAGLLAVAVVTFIVAWPLDGTAQATGVVSGTVRVARPPAAPAPTKVTVQADVCGQTVPSDELAVTRGALGGAVVWLEGVPAPAGTAPRPVQVTLDQHRCRFEPHVQTATVGATVGLTSRDPILHNIHAYLGTRTLFNVAIPVAGMVVRRPLGEAGRVQIKCDVHAWMSSWIVVFNHPYHAVTSADGSFRIQGVPPGTYPLKVWHERLGEKSASATVSSAVTVSF